MEELDPALRQQLKTAVKSVPTPPFLDARIRAGLLAAPTTRSPRRWGLVWTAAVALTLCAFGAFEYQHGHFRYTRPSQDEYISSISGKVAKVMRVGLGDHVHCAVFRKYPAHPPTAEKTIADLGPTFAPLLPVVRKHVPEQYRLVMAHRCGYRGRKFVHFTFKDADGLISVVIASKQEGEGFSSAELGEALTNSGLPIYRSRVQDYQIAGFDAGQYLAYVVSDLSSTDNSQIAVALSPELQHSLAQLHS